MFLAGFGQLVPVDPDLNGTRLGHGHAGAPRQGAAELLRVCVMGVRLSPVRPFQGRSLKGSSGYCGGLRCGFRARDFGTHTDTGSGGGVQASSTPSVLMKVPLTGGVTDGLTVPDLVGKKRFMLSLGQDEAEEGLIGCLG